MIKRPETLPEQQVILTREHLPLYGLSAKKVERAMIHEGFPPAIKLGARTKGWFRHEVVEWIAQRPRGIHPCLGTGQFTPERIEEQQRKRATTMAANRRQRETAE